MGCSAAPSPQLQRKMALYDQTIPVCSTEPECDAKWETAQLWVARNAGYKIQTATNVLIETYNSVGSSAAIQVRVLKEPAGGGAYRLLVYVSCANLFGCVPDTWDAAIDFNRYVGAVGE